MEMVQRIFSPIKRQFGQLTVTHKLFMGSIFVILAMTLFIVSQYTGKATMQELLPGATPAELDAADAYLGEIGVPTQRQNNKLLVPAAQKQQALIRLAESNRLPNDKAILFENILSNPSWTNSRQQNDQLYNNALQNELGLRIAEFKGIKSAKVFLDIPDNMGFGQIQRKPSASATVLTDNGSEVPQSTVDAIAQFISGSKAGLTADRVRIIDASNGKQRKALSEEESLPTTYIEHAARVEAQTRDKVQELLAYIPGVVVAVTAHVDVTRSKAEVRTHLPEKQGTIALRRKESETSNTSTQSRGSAEPGFGANQTADINRGPSAPGDSTEQTTVTTEYENHVGTRLETILDPKGHPTMVAVSVNIPRGFVVSLVKASKPAAAAGSAAPAAAPTDAAAADAEPSEDEINTRFATIRKDIVESLLPHVRAMTAMANTNTPSDEVKKIAEESIGVSLIPIDMPASMFPQQAGLLGGLGSVLGGGSGGISGGGMLSMADGLFDKAVLGLLAIAAMGMMVMMVKKAGKKESMPSAEELVGLPPTLDTNSDIVGEAEEIDTAMAGIEVDEASMQAQKILEQVTKIVADKPDKSAKILNRWISVEQ